MMRTAFILILLSALWLPTLALAGVSAEKKARIVDILKRVNRTYDQLEQQQKREQKVQIIEDVERFQVGEELILTVTVDNLLLGDLFAIKNEKNARFGLDTFFEALNFPIQVDLDNLTADGWFIRENNQFSLRFVPADVAANVAAQDITSTGVLPELTQGQEQAGVDGDANDITSDALPLDASGDYQAILTINGETVQLAPDMYAIEGDDIYVDANALSTWFGIAMNFDFELLRVDLVPSRPLPIQEKLARKNRHLSKGLANPQPVLPFRETTYQAISPQTSDVQISANYRNDELTGIYSVLGARDVAFYSTRFFFSGNDLDLLSDSRLTFDKASTSADLLGPLKATNYQFGDVTGARIGGGATSTQSRGFAFDNDPIGSFTDLEVTSLSGPIEPGWDVELYRNGILLDRLLDKQDGRYEFNDVPLLFGSNEFELVFYGPEGQVRTEKEQFTLDSNALSNDETRYSVSLVQLDESLLGVSSFNQNDQLDRGFEFSGNYRRGISDNLSVRAGHALQFGGRDDLNRYSVGANATVFDNVLLGTDYLVDDDGGDNFLLTARAPWKSQSLNLVLRSARSSDEGVRSNSANVTVSGPVISTRGVRLGHQTQTFLQDNGDGGQLFSLGNSLALNVNRYSFNNFLNWTRNDIGLTEQSNINGALSVQRSFGPVFARLQASYDLYGGFELTDLSSQLSWSFTEDLRSRVNLTYDPESDNSRINWQLNLRQEKYDLASNLIYNQATGWQVGLTTRFSLGYTDDSGLFATPLGLASGGTMMVRVFQDENVNGKYDEGELLLPQVKVRAVQLYRTEETDVNGIAVLTGLSSNRPTDIELDRATLPDAYMLPAFPGISILPRNGFIDTLDFPIVYGSEIEGVLYLSDEEGVETSLPYAPMQVFNNEGEIVASAESEFDGYYLFTDLPPGNYEVTLERKYAEDNGLSKVRPRKLSLSFQGELSSGNDFLLKKQRLRSGYVANIATFNSVAVLKVYWKMLKKRLGNQPEMAEAFYMQDEESKRYQLNLAFNAERSEVDASCDYAKQVELDCTVLDIDFMQ